MKFLKVI